MKSVNVFGIPISKVTKKEAVDIIISWVTEDRKEYMVSPNLDNIVKLIHSNKFREAYKNASLIVPDGMPLIWTSQIFGTPLTERVSGADLILPILKSAEQHKMSVFFVGSDTNTLLLACSNILKLYPSIQILGSHAPSMGFEKNQEEIEQILQIINMARPDILFIGLGAPKQEILVFENKERLIAHAIIPIGAGIEFIAGTKSRAPLFLQKIGLEWFWRLIKEPKRLWLRYLNCILWIPILFYYQYRYRGMRLPIR